MLYTYYNIINIIMLSLQRLHSVRQCAHPSIGCCRKEAIALYHGHGSCFGLCFGTGASWRPRDALATFLQAGGTTRHSTDIDGADQTTHCALRKALADRERHVIDTLATANDRERHVINTLATANCLEWRSVVVGVECTLLI